MRTFLIIWLGQFASALGSEMTNFAITIWAWEVTGQATPLSLILAVTQIPRLLVSPFAGIWVDLFDRKYLMLLGDAVAGLSTLALLGLLLTDNLQIWQLYVSGAVNGLFGYIQGLAHSASISLLIPQKHYARASAFESLQMSGSYVIAPAIAGALYAIAGLSGILAIDLVTCGVALGKQTETQKLSTAYEAKLQTVKDHLSRTGQNPQVSVVSIFPKLIRASGTETFAGSVLADAGISRPPSQAQAQGPQNISLEALDLLDGDVIFIQTQKGNTQVVTEMQSEIDRIKAHPLWSRLKAVQTNQVYEVGPHWAIGSYIAANLILDDLLEHLVKRQ